MFMLAFIIGSVIGGFMFGDTFLESVGWGFMIWCCLNVAGYLLILGVAGVMHLMEDSE